MDDDFNCTTWWFVDSTKKISGPWSASQMETKFEKGEIDGQTGIRCNENTPFITIENWFLSGNSAFLSKIPDTWPNSTSKIVSSNNKDCHVIGSNSENSNVNNSNNNNNNWNNENDSKYDENKSNDSNMCKNKNLIGAPFWDKLEKNGSKNILLSGCGGGFDIYNGLPLYFTLKNMGYNVYLANYTFHSLVDQETNLEKWYYLNDEKEKNDSNNNKNDKNDKNDKSDEFGRNPCIVLTNARALKKKMQETNPKNNKNSNNNNNTQLDSPKSTNTSVSSNDDFDNDYNNNNNKELIDKSDIMFGLSQYGRYYYPEYYLSKFFDEKLNQDVTIYTFPRWGCKQLTQQYKYLTQKLNIDTVIIVDGGTDSLMKGNEHEIGTVEEDFASIFSVEQLDNNKIHTKILCCLGMGVDRFHGVSDVSTLRAISELTVNNSYLGCNHLLPNMKPCQLYRQIVEYSCHFTQTQTIVGTSILTSIQGKFGNEHWAGQSRTKGSKLFINPLMGIYWFFDNNGVYQRIHKSFKIKEFFDSESAGQLRQAVYKARSIMANSNDKNDQIAENHEDYPATDDLRD